MSRGQYRFAEVLRPLIFAVVSEVPLSTTEIVEHINDLLRQRGAREDIRGVMVEFPITQACLECGLVHQCIHRLPLSTILAKPQLDALARAGALTKYSRGTSKAAIWTLAEIQVPNSPEDLFGE